MKFAARERVVAVKYPAEHDEVREVEIRGLARSLGLKPHVPFDYTRFSGGRSLPDREILLGEGKDAIRVPRGHWFVVHPRSGKPLFEVLSDVDFRAAFAGPDRDADSARVLADAVATEAHYHLGRQTELRYLDANDHSSGMWAHPGMQAVIAGIREQLRERGAEMWELVDRGEQERWDRNRAVLPVTVRVRPELSRHGGTHGQARHAIPDTDTRGSRPHRGGRALCESASRPAPMPLGPVTVAPPDCPRCMTHLRRIAERRGLALEEPPAPPQPPADESDKVGPETPSIAADLADLGDGWRLVQYGDSDRWWLLQHDRIRGYIHRYTNMSGNKTGWEAFQFVGHGRYRHLDATSAAKHRPTSSYLWRSVALAAWGIATAPGFDARNPAWTRGWRPPRNNP